MYEIKILDYKKPLIFLKWSGIVSKKEALDVIPDLLEAGEKVGGKFNLIVDTSEMIVNDATDEFTQHQKAVLHMINVIAVVNKSQLTKLQLRKMAKNAGNDKDHFFETYEDAYNWIITQ